MAFLAADSKTNLFYNDWGSGNPVVLLHGWPLDSSMWSDQAVFLAEHGQRVIMYDRRGFGRSDQPWSGFDLDTLADDLNSVLEQLDLQKVTLVGFSMASGEVARYLARHGSARIDRVVLVAADTPYLLRTDDNPNGIDRAQIDLMIEGLRKDRPKFLKAFSDTFYGNSALQQNVSPEMMAWTQQMGMGASLQATIGCVLAIFETDFRLDMAAFDVPTLIIHGTADQTSPIALTGHVTAKAILGAQLIEYDGEPHALYATAKDRLSSDLLSYIQRDRVDANGSRAEAFARSRGRRRAKGRSMVEANFDVVVIGGGAAGVGAAVGAAQAGAKTLLVESGPCLGGAATQKNVMTYCGLYTASYPARQAVGGVADQVLEQLRMLGGVRAPVRLNFPHDGVIAILDPEAVKLALDRVTQVRGLTVLLHTMLVSASRCAGQIESVTLQDHGGPRTVEARAFVDASGEGDLAAFSGASVRYGTHGSHQTGTLSVRFGGIRLGSDLSTKRWAQAIQAAKQRDKSSLLTKEAGLILPIPISGDLMTLLIDADYDAVDGASVSQAEVQGRRRAWAYLEAARTIPGYENAYIVSTGPNFGTRESRHVNSFYQVTEADVTGGARHEDVIALGAWPMEYHPGADLPVAWRDIKDLGTFDIPLRTLRSRNTTNLYAAGRLVDGDGGGGGAMRVMGTSFATGQAAGVAAALQTSGITDIGTVQAELERQGAKLRDEDTKIVESLGPEANFDFGLARRSTWHFDELRNSPGDSFQGFCLAHSAWCRARYAPSAFEVEQG